MDSIHPTSKHIVLGGTLFSPYWTRRWLWREEAGIVGGAFSWTTWCSLDVATLPGVAEEVPVSSRSALRTSFSLSTSCPPCIMLSLFNNVAHLWDLTMVKSSSSSIGVPRWGAFAWHTTQSSRFRLCYPISNALTTICSSNCPCVFSSLVNTPSTSACVVQTSKTPSYSSNRLGGPSESESSGRTVCLYYSVAASSVNGTFWLKTLELVYTYTKSSAQDECRILRALLWTKE
jgi:hypothetical protein